MVKVKNDIASKSQRNLIYTGTMVAASVELGKRPTVFAIKEKGEKLADFQFRWVRFPGIPSQAKLP